MPKARPKKATAKPRTVQALKPGSFRASPPNFQKLDLDEKSRRLWATCPKCSNRQLVCTITRPHAAHVDCCLGRCLVEIGG